MKIRISLLIFTLIPILSFSQSRVIDNKGTLKTIDESKWVLNGSDIHLKQNGNVGIGTNSPKAKFHVNGSTLFETSVITDKPTGGVIGTATETVDSYTAFNLNQTTAGQTLSLPTPTNTLAGRILQVNNIGTVSVTIGTITIDAQQTTEFVWNGSGWAVSTAIPQVISGTKTFSAAPSAPSLNLSGSNNQLQFNAGTATGTFTWQPTGVKIITFPDKTGTVALTTDITSPTLDGDVTRSIGSTYLDKIQGNAINAAFPQDKQVLQYNLSHSAWEPAFSVASFSLNNLTTSTQALGIGTAGTAPAWNSLTATHTLNIPLASTASVTAGLLSNTDWSSFNTKVSSVTAGSTKITIGGTVTAPIVDVDPSKLGTVTLATTTTGADISVTGSPANFGGTLTLNVPDASGTARGVITTGAQTIAGNKIFSGSTTVFGSGEGGTPTTTFIRGPQAGGTGTSGADLYIQASNGTGAGKSGNIIFQTGAAGTVSVPTVSNVVNQAFLNSLTQTLSYTVPNGGTNQVLMVEVNIGYNGPTVTSITYNGSALSSLGYITSGSNRMEIWYLVAPASGASKDIVVTLNNYANVGLTAMTWVNVNQSTPFGTVVPTNNAYNSSASLLPSSSLGQVVMDFLTTTTTPVTATAGQTSITSFYNGSSCYNTSGYKAANSGTTTMSYSFGSSNFGYMAFAINSSTTGGGNALSDALIINNSGNTVIAKGKSLALTDGGVNTVSLTAPSSVSTAYVLKLPAVQGGGGQTLLNDGNGSLSWGVPASTYTLPAATGSTLGGVKVGSGLSVDGTGLISATNSGTVTSIGLSLPTEMTVTNSPLTSSGTLTATWASRPANTFFAAPNGASGTPAFRAIATADIPSIDLTSKVSGILPPANGGTGVANSGKITLGGDLTTSGAFATTFTNTGTSTVTLPTTGTLYGTAASSISSSQLSTSLSDETGSGIAVFSDSPSFTGTPTLPTATIATTQTFGNNTTAVATTAFVQSETPSYSLVTGANATNVTTALADIAGLSFAAAANSVYEFEAVLSVQSSSTAGNSYAVNYSATLATVEAQITGTLAAATQKTLRINALNTSATPFVTSGSTGGILIKGIFTTGTNVGNFVIRHAKVTSGTSTVFVNSFLKVTKIQ
ncbi:MAG: hypothetical protein JZU53_01555 [Paludibacter sp.]|nr:hypothetical protein [Paludibacter sp.]